MNNNNNFRRDFLKKCALFGLGGATSSFTTLGALSSTALAATRPEGYRAMVCIYLEGGMDCNVLVKDTDEHYAAYEAARGERALDRSEILKIDSGSDKFGLHPSMVEARELYNANKLAFIANVGALKEPTTAAQFNNKAVDLPPKLFSHITQKNFIRAGLPFEGERRTGWAGRIADLYNDTWPSQIPFNISTANTNNVWQEGVKTSAYGLGSVVHVLAGYQPGVPGEQDRRAALDALHNVDYGNTFINEQARIFKESIDNSDFVRANINVGQAIPITTRFPTSRVGRGLKNIARAINARQRFGVANESQAFYFKVEGYDHHTGLEDGFPRRLSELSKALEAFYAATEEMGLQDDIVTFTNSDFGRTSVGNQSGSDHGWGGHQLVMGGRVNGGQVYGQYPLFSGDDPQYLENGRGVLVPSTSHDQMSSTIAKWFGGFTDPELEELLPLMNNFSVKDLGFMSNA